MKYSDNNKPLICMMTNSTCYKQTEKMKIKGILWHSTGANNKTLKRYVQPSESDKDYKALLNKIGQNKNKNDWNHTQQWAGVNAWVGTLADGTVTAVQTLPWYYKPWGCGSGNKGSCNDGWIQFEICENDLVDGDYFAKAYEEACELTAYLCKLYDIDPNGTVKVNGVKIPTILCHQDSYNLGFGTGHSDVMHWFPKFGKSMATVRQDVTALLEGDEEELTQEKFNEMMTNYIAQLAAQPVTWEKEAMEWAQSKNLINGNSAGQLMAKKYITRGEFAVVLKRFAELMGLK